MIIGIGIDSVEIHRFNHWHTYNKKQLQRLFSESEIAFCLSEPRLSAERFAIRFAAREACYKAFGHIVKEHMIPFLTLCKAITIHRSAQGFPSVMIDWKALQPYTKKPSPPDYELFLSLTHTEITATAFVIIQSKIKY